MLYSSLQTMLDNYPETLTPRDLAKVLGVTRRTIYNYIDREHDFPKYIRVGRKMLFPKSEVAQYLETKRA